LLGSVRDQDPNAALVSSLGLEKDINTFFRLQSPTVIARLQESFPDLPEHPDARTVFIKLRDLRNSW
jgi:hydroxyacylglutathione hydrolase